VSALSKYLSSSWERLEIIRVHGKACSW